MDAARIEEGLREDLSKREGVACAYLFGSLARGTASADSDADVAVLFDRDPPRALEGVPARLEAELTQRAGVRVDVVVLNYAPVDLIQRVLRDGKLLSDRDPSRRIAFEVRARNLYWDLEPVLRRYRHRAVHAR
jgi:uncharacterized protein